MSVVLLGSTSGSITLQEPAVAGTNTVNFGANTGVAILDANTPAFRNRLINSDMRIDQRNAGASVSNANGYTLDRWYFMRGASSSSPIFNVQQSTTIPPNYKNSLLVTVGTSGAPGANNYSALYQIIEGLNVSDFGFGTATATSITLSFWVNCSVTGTYGVAFQNSATDRSYIASYAVNTANTWEQKTITIVGDTSGTWLTTSGAGLSVYWDMGVGTGQSTTAGSWQAGNYLGLTGGTKLSNTGSATFYITGVQLEKGSTATSFDYRSYGTELALCQRYLPTLTASAAGTVSTIGAGLNTTSARVVIPFAVTPRVSPTGVTVVSVGNFGLTSTGSGGVSASAIAFDSASFTGASVTVTVASGMTANGAHVMYQTSPAQLQFTGCEL